MRNAQKWLTDKISGPYKDKDLIIETVLFECLTRYVEDELDGDIEIYIKANQKNNGGTAWHQFYIELKEKYNIFKNEIPSLEKELFKYDAELETYILSDRIKGNAKTTISNINQITDKIEKSKNEICEWIVKNKEFLWT